MYYIAYLSTAYNLIGEEELERILEVSRRNNTENNITGLLIHVDGSIIQFLEGEKEIVLSTYRKILKDPRHFGIIKLMEGELTERNFPDWSMGYESISKSSISDYEGFTSLKDGMIGGKVDLDRKHPAIIILKSFMKNNIFKRGL